MVATTAMLLSPGALLQNGAGFLLVAFALLSCQGCQWLRSAPLLSCAVSCDIM